MVSNKYSCTDSSNIINITLYTRPDVTISQQGALSFCEGGFVNLSVTQTQAASYRWQRNRVDLPNDTLQSLKTSTSGVYRVIVSNMGLCSDPSSVVDITVNPNPVASINPNGNLSFCEGKSVELNASHHSAYQWLRNGLALSADTLQKVKLYSEGQYRVLVTDTNGCSDTSASVSVVVNPKPFVSIGSGGTLSFCEGSSVLLNSSQHSFYQWIRNGVKLSPDTFRQLAVSISGSYQVIAGNAFGCIDTSAGVNIVANPKPITSAISGETLVDTSSTLSYTVTNIDGSLYSWNVVNGFILSGNSSSTVNINWGNVIGRGLIKVVETNANGCIGDTVFKQINIRAHSASDSIEWSIDTLFFSAAGETSSANLHSNTNWQLSGIPAWVSVSSLNGTGSSILTFTAQANPGGMRFATILAAISSQVKELVLAQHMSTGVGAYNLNTGVGIYPNPSNGYFTLYNTDGLALTINIYNLTGKCISSFTMTNNQQTIDLSYVADGIYTIGISSGDMQKTMRLAIIK